MGLYTPTYAANIRGLVVGATPTDIFSMLAGTTKRVEVQYLDVAFTQTTAGTIDIDLVKRSTPNSGGTTSPVTITQFDSTDPGPQATFLAYTANPASLGTLIGPLFLEKIFGNVVGAQVDRLIIDCSKMHWNKGIVLQPGSQENIGFNLNAIASPAGNLFDFNVIWTEQ